MYHLVDFQTKEKVSPQSLVFTGSNGPWEVIMDLGMIKAKLHLDYFKSATPCLGKYLPFLPIQEASNFISLKETATPLIKSRNLGKKLGIHLYFKLESKNITGSFKDRGSAVDLSVAKEMHAKGIILASTGNMGASCSCYAAAAQIPCFVLVPEDTPLAKLAQVIVFGGKIIKVKGSYTDAARMSQAIAEQLHFFLAGDYAFRVEGQKTAAFELIDQLTWQEPDMAIIPIGCGTNMAAYAKGFAEYKQLGLISKIPQLIGVQAEGACPVVKSFESHSYSIDPIEDIHTIASAIAIGKPIDGIKALDAIYTTNGQAVSVSDEEILKALHQLATEEGLFVESSSATTFAALIKLTSMQDLRGKKIVCILTGDGLKDPSVPLQMVSTTPVINPKEEEFIDLYEKQFFQNEKKG